MKNNHPLLSICIPCFDRIEYVRNTLKSIYQDNKDVCLNEYEVVLSDNDPNQTVKTLVKEFEKYGNLHYFHTECEGFMNSYHVLTYAKGDFLKLHNSQTLFLKGALRKIVDEVKEQRKNRTMIFYTNGLLSKFHSTFYDTFENFMQSLSYWSSWSNGFNIWRQDFEKIGCIELNKLFPHTSLFLTQYEAKKYCIDDKLLFKVQRIPKRGGHNKFEAFTIEYPSLIDKCRQNGHISIKCQRQILNDIMIEFLPSLIFNKYIARIETFDASDFRKNIKKYFPAYAYGLVWSLACFQPIRLAIRNIKNIIHRK